MAIPYALKVLENPMRDVNSRYSLLCQSLGMQGWQRLKVVELRALKRPLAGRWRLPACCRLAILALWPSSATRISARCRSGFISKLAPIVADGAVTALLLLLLCFALFTVIENFRGVMLKLTDVTRLYEHLPMRFTLSVRQESESQCLASGRKKYPAQSDCRFYSLPAGRSSLIMASIPTLRRLSARCRCCSENNLFNHLTVWQNIALGMDPGLKLNVAQRQTLEAIAEQMGGCVYQQTTG